jgi:peptide/nickel transport system ATP-binding protein
LSAVRRSTKSLLAIEGLTVAYNTAEGLADVVRSVTLRIEPGQTYGLVGESGSGKSTLALAALNHLPRAAVVRGGRILFGGLDILGSDERAMRRLWGRDIGYVPQDPHASLNPSLRIGDQLMDVLNHAGMDQPAARRRMLELMTEVHLPDPTRLAQCYPHQLSGGMKQRILIAMAISREPKLLVMDEPTTGLDATTQAGILDLIGGLIRRRDTAVLYVSHNLGVVARLCSRVGVLYAGELLEDGPATALYARPLHPYTQGLLDSVPRLGQNKGRIGLRAIAGLPPSPIERIPGCVFAPRCPLVVAVCETAPPLFETEPGHRSRCHRWEEIRGGTADPHQPARAPADRRSTQASPPVTLAAHEVMVEFPVRRSLADIIARRPQQRLRAVDRATFTVRRGRALGLVGESGSGKTSLASAIMGLIERTSGDIRLMDQPLPRGLSGRDRATLARMQMIFQDVDESLIPTMTVGATLTRSILRLGRSPEQRLSAQVDSLIEAVRLPPEMKKRYPSQLSGGERQRVAIARAIASTPDLLVADEPVSSLDVSVQAAVLNLLDELQVERKGSLLFISHDLAVVGFISDVVAVIYLGTLMQLSPAREIFDPPYHPYAEALLSAIPLIDPEATPYRVRLEGDTPSPVDVPAGCPFHARCPRLLGDICRVQRPLEQKTESGGMILCHIPLEELRATQTRAFRFSRPVEGLD